MRGRSGSASQKPLKNWARIAPERVPVDRASLEERLRAVTKEDRLRSAVELRRAHLPGGRLGKRSASGRIGEIPHDPLEEVDESLGAGVDHPGFAKRRHLLRRVLEGALRDFQRVGEEDGEVADVLRAVGAGAGPVADDREDGALDGTRHRAVGGVGGFENRGPEVARRDARPVGQPFAEAGEELGEDGARVASRARERFVRERRGHPADVPLLQPRDTGGDLLERRREVGACVPVGHRKDVDLVERLGALADEVGSRDHGARQPSAVEIPDRDHGSSGAG